MTRVFLDSALAQGPNRPNVGAFLLLLQGKFLVGNLVLMLVLLLSDGILDHGLHLLHLDGIRKRSGELQVIPTTLVIDRLGRGLVLVEFFVSARGRGGQTPVASLTSKSFCPWMVLQILPNKPNKGNDGSSEAPSLPEMTLSG